MRVAFIPLLLIASCLRSQLEVDAYTCTSQTVATAVHIRSNDAGEDSFIATDCIFQGTITVDRPATDPQPFQFVLQGCTLMGAVSVDALSGVREIRVSGTTSLGHIGFEGGANVTGPISFTSSNISSFQILDSRLKDAAIVVKDSNFGFGQTWAAFTIQIYRSNWIHENVSVKLYSSHFNARAEGFGLVGRRGEYHHVDIVVEHCTFSVLEPRGTSGVFSFTSTHLYSAGVLFTYHSPLKGLRFRMYNVTAQGQISIAPAGIHPFSPSVMDFTEVGTVPIGSQPIHISMYCPSTSTPDFSPASVVERLSMNRVLSPYGATLLQDCQVQGIINVTNSEFKQLQYYGGAMSGALSILQSSTVHTSYQHSNNHWLNLSAVVLNCTIGTNDTQYVGTEGFSADPLTLIARRDNRLTHDHINFTVVDCTVRGSHDGIGIMTYSDTVRRVHWTILRTTVVGTITTESKRHYGNGAVQHTLLRNCTMSIRDVVVTATATSPGGIILGIGNTTNHGSNEYAPLHILNVSITGARSRIDCSPEAANRQGFNVSQVSFSHGVEFSDCRSSLLRIVDSRCTAKSAQSISYNNGFLTGDITVVGSSLAGGTVFRNTLVQDIFILVSRSTLGTANRSLAQPDGFSLIQESPKSNSKIQFLARHSKFYAAHRAVAFTGRDNTQFLGMQVDIEHCHLIAYEAARFPAIGRSFSTHWGWSGGVAFTKTAIMHDMSFRLVTSVIRGNLEIGSGNASFSNTSANHDSARRAAIADPNGTYEGTSTFAEEGIVILNSIQQSGDFLVENYQATPEFHRLRRFIARNFSNNGSFTFKAIQTDAFVMESVSATGVELTASTGLHCFSVTNTYIEGGSFLIAAALVNVEMVFEDFHIYPLTTTGVRASLGLRFELDGRGYYTPTSRNVSLTVRRSFISVLDKALAFEAVRSRIEGPVRILIEDSKLEAVRGSTSYALTTEHKYSAGVVMTHYIYLREVESFIVRNTSLRGNVVVSPSGAKIVSLAENTFDRSSFMLQCQPQNPIADVSIEGTVGSGPMKLQAVSLVDCSINRSLLLTSLEVSPGQIIVKSSDRANPASLQAAMFLWSNVSVTSGALFEQYNITNSTIRIVNSIFGDPTKFDNPAAVTAWYGIQMWFGYFPSSSVHLSIENTTLVASKDGIAWQAYDQIATGSSLHLNNVRVSGGEEALTTHIGLSSGNHYVRFIDFNHTITNSHFNGSVHLRTGEGKNHVSWQNVTVGKIEYKGNSPVTRSSRTENTVDFINVSAADGVVLIENDIGKRLTIRNCTIGSQVYLQDSAFAPRGQFLVEQTNIFSGSSAGGLLHLVSINTTLVTVSIINCSILERLSTTIETKAALHINTYYLGATLLVTGMQLQIVSSTIRGNNGPLAITTASRPNPFAVNVTMVLRDVVFLPASLVNYAVDSQISLSSGLQRMFWVNSSIWFQRVVFPQRGLRMDLAAATIHLQVTSVAESQLECSSGCKLQLGSAPAVITGGTMTGFTNETAAVVPPSFAVRRDVWMPKALNTSADYLHLHAAVETRSNESQFALPSCYAPPAKPRLPNTPSRTISRTVSLLPFASPTTTTVLLIGSVSTTFAPQPPSPPPTPAANGTKPNSSNWKASGSRTTETLPGMKERTSSQANPLFDQSKSNRWVKVTPEMYFRTASQTLEFDPAERAAAPAPPVPLRTAAMPTAVGATASIALTTAAGGGSSASDLQGLLVMGFSVCSTPFVKEVSIDSEQAVVPLVLIPGRPAGGSLGALVLAVALVVLHAVVAAMYYRLFAVRKRLSSFTAAAAAVKFPGLGLNLTRLLWQGVVLEFLRAVTANPINLADVLVTALVMLLFLGIQLLLLFIGLKRLPDIHFVPFTKKRFILARFLGPVGYWATADDWAKMFRTSYSANKKRSYAPLRLVSLLTAVAIAVIVTVGLSCEVQAALLITVLVIPVLIQAVLRPLSIPIQYIFTVANAACGIVIVLASLIDSLATPAAAMMIAAPYISAGSTVAAFVSRKVRDKWKKAEEKEKDLTTASPSSGPRASVDSSAEDTEMLALGNSGSSGGELQSPLLAVPQKATHNPLMSW